ncbi:hypothetical protein D3C73_1192530 [compost metagenome]
MVHRLRGLDQYFRMIDQVIRLVDYFLGCFFRIEDEAEGEFRRVHHAHHRLFQQRFGKSHRDRVRLHHFLPPFRHSIGIFQPSEIHGIHRGELSIRIIDFIQEVG